MALPSSGFNLAKAYEKVSGVSNKNARVCASRYIANQKFRESLVGYLTLLPKENLSSLQLAQLEKLLVKALEKELQNA